MFPPITPQIQNPDQLELVADEFELLLSFLEELDLRGIIPPLSIPPLFSDTEQASPPAPPVSGSATRRPPPSKRRQRRYSK